MSAGTPLALSMNACPSCQAHATLGSLRSTREEVLEHTMQALGEAAGAGNMAAEQDAVSSVIMQLARDSRPARGLLQEYHRTHGTRTLLQCAAFLHRHGIFGHAVYLCLRFFADVSLEQVDFDQVSSDSAQDAIQHIHTQMQEFAIYVPWSRGSDENFFLYNK